MLLRVNLLNYVRNFPISILSSYIIVNNLMSDYEINPGEQLQNFLKTLYPLNIENSNDIEQQCFIHRVDQFIMADGSFRKLVYDSTINYLVRRLIKSAEYLRKKYDSDNFPPEKFVNKLRKFIKENTTIDENNGEKLLALLQKCL